MIQEHPLNVPTKKNDSPPDPDTVVSELLGSAHNDIGDAFRSGQEQSEPVDKEQAPAVEKRRVSKGHDSPHHSKVEQPETEASSTDTAESPTRRSERSERNTTTNEHTPEHIVTDAEHTMRDFAKEVGELRAAIAQSDARIKEHEETITDLVNRLGVVIKDWGEYGEELEHLRTQAVELRARLERLQARARENVIAAATWEEARALAEKHQDKQFIFNGRVYTRVGDAYILNPDVAVDEQAVHMPPVSSSPAEEQSEETVADSNAPDSEEDIPTLTDVVSKPGEISYAKTQTQHGTESGKEPSSASEEDIVATPDTSSHEYRQRRLMGWLSDANRRIDDTLERWYSDARLGIGGNIATRITKRLMYRIFSDRGLISAVGSATLASINQFRSGTTEGSDSEYSENQTVTTETSSSRRGIRRRWADRVATREYELHQKYREAKEELAQLSDRTGLQARLRRRHLNKQIERTRKKIIKLVTPNSFSERMAHHVIGGKNIAAARSNRFSGGYDGPQTQERPTDLKVVRENLHRMAKGENTGTGEEASRGASAETPTEAPTETPTTSERMPEELRQAEKVRSALVGGLDEDTFWAAAQETPAGTPIASPNSAAIPSMMLYQEDAIGELGDTVNPKKNPQLRAMTFAQYIVYVEGKRQRNNSHST